jgi:hypothetical protein
MAAFGVVSARVTVTVPVNDLDAGKIVGVATGALLNKP